MKPSTSHSLIVAGLSLVSASSAITVNNSYVPYLDPWNPAKTLVDSFDFNPLQSIGANGQWFPGMLVADRSRFVFSMII